MSTRPADQHPPTTAQQLADLFSVLAPAFLKWQYAGILVQGMTYPRMRLIHELSEEGPQTMGALRDKLGVSARTITVLVDGLERDGFAKRAPHPEDRRATLVELTDQGRAAHHTVYAAHADRAAALFATLDHHDQQALLGLMRRLLDALAATSSAEGRPLNLDTQAFRGG
jgi:DNA-binding MarR family transcriptional regulator